jgi:ATP-binding cassette subfamily B protein
MSNTQNFKDNFMFFVGFLKPYKAKIKWLVLFHIIKRLPFLAIAPAVMIIIDNYIPSGDIKKIIILSILLFFGILFGVIYQISYSLVSEAQIGKKVAQDLRNVIVNKLQLLSIGFHNRTHSGKLYSKIMVDVDKIERFSNMFFQVIIFTVLNLLITVLVLVTVNYKMLLLYLIIIPLFLVLYFVYIGKIKKYQHESRKAGEKVTASIVSFMHTQELSRMHGEEEFEYSRVKECGNTELTTLKKLRTLNAFYIAQNACLGQIINIVIVAIGAYGVVHRMLSIGELFLFLHYVSLIINNISSIMDQFPQLTEFSEGVDSIHEVLGSKDIESAGRGKFLDFLTGNITFKDVSFIFPEGKKIFSNLNFSCEAGETIALVGSSGSGKSTFVNLLLGLYHVNKGSIIIDNVPIDNINIQSLRQYVGVVTQEPIIFSGTIKENIVHANKTCSQEEVDRAAKLANAYDFIMNTDKGFDTLVGEGGAMLSGGQKQRVAIARAMLRNPKLLILDEATSALDSRSESEVQKALDSIQGLQTTFVIAHRLSTIFNADRILVFDNGTIVEQGTHYELCSKGGMYAGLLAIQMNVPVKEIQQLKP